MKPVTPLTDTKIRKAKPKDRPYRLFDGGGLALLVSPTGVKSWQLRYRHHGTEQTLTLGKVDRLSLAEARIEADKARALAAAGEHLTTVKRVTKAKRTAEAANTFGAAVATWLKSEAKRAEWTPDYKDSVAASLRNHLSALDAVPLTKITAALVSPHLRKIERDSSSTLGKVKPRLLAILDDAVESGLIPINPIPRGRRRKNPDRKHYPAVVDLPGVGAILRAAENAEAAKGIRRAHALLVLTGQRIENVVGAKWSQFKLDDDDWIIPRPEMKVRTEERGDHVVPLSPGLLKLLRKWRDIDADDAIYVCPGRNPAKPVTSEAVQQHYRKGLKLEGKHSPHSWRSAFSTICREGGQDAAAIEAMLDHVVGGVQGAYDRSRLIEQRRKLVKWYESTLIAARDGAEVIAMRR